MIHFFQKNVVWFQNVLYICNTENEIIITQTTTQNGTDKSI